MPRCPLGQQPGPLTQKAAASPFPPQGAGRQAPSPVNLFSSLALHSLSWAQP